MGQRDDALQLKYEYMSLAARVREPPLTSVYIDRKAVENALLTDGDTRAVSLMVSDRYVVMLETLTHM